MILVASYCRVSTDKEDQANSFEAQQRYFKEYIDRQPDWELYQVYADEGITGTSTKKRIQFNRMINDAKQGMFKLIITKEVSRFSRNILDTIAYTRELKSIGVGVLFMNDGISTLEPDAELRLSIMGSIAQEESRKTSTRVKWGQMRSMERGVVFGRSMLGYDVKDGKMTVNEEGAELVRLIFYKYGVEKKGTSIIARELREAGYLTFSGNAMWSNSHIVKILKNEKYVGDLVQKKTYTPDYLTHQKKYNYGAESKVSISNHHEPIVDRELWNIVQDELVRRNRNGYLSEGHGNRYLLSGKIFCGICGSSFVARKKRFKNGVVRKKWGCFSATNNGKSHIDAVGNTVGCDIGIMVRDDFVTDVIYSTAKIIISVSGWIEDQVCIFAKRMIAAYEATTGVGAENLELSIQQITAKKERILDAFFSRDITKEEMRLMNESYDRQINELKIKLLATKAGEQLNYNIQDLVGDVKTHFEQLMSRELDEKVLSTVVDSITVFPDRKLELKLNLLPCYWQNVLESIAEIRLHTAEGLHFDPSVPISVSRPFNSSKGML